MYVPVCECVYCCYLKSFIDSLWLICLHSLSPTTDVIISISYHRAVHSLEPWSNKYHRLNSQVSHCIYLLTLFTCDVYAVTSTCIQSLTTRHTLAATQWYFSSKINFSFSFHFFLLSELLFYFVLVFWINDNSSFYIVFKG